MQAQQSAKPRQVNAFSHQTRQRKWQGSALSHRILNEERGCWLVLRAASANSPWKNQVLSLAMKIRKEKTKSGSGRSRELRLEDGNGLDRPKAGRRGKNCNDATPGFLPFVSEKANLLAWHRMRRQLLKGSWHRDCLHSSLAPAVTGALG